jgi:hypothetical protein
VCAIVRERDCFYYFKIAVYMCIGGWVWVRKGGREEVAQEVADELRLCVVGCWLGFQEGGRRRRC